MGRMKPNSPQYKLAKRRARAKIKAFMFKHHLVLYILSSETRRRHMLIGRPALHSRMMQVRLHLDLMMEDAYRKGYLSDSFVPYRKRKIL